ncbi:DNA polymerase III subunit gamma/tau [Oecophyllibacter saccharovorans]|uniref:DNA polymerase III subunit gamma/tau n=1 Tax=Oecophyllibacter saccharovorans TaxID=2558360 RepID=A0A506ULF2_9PROT|nr:DNA polymerase III subunit gamma/tau [Oecophyllibacter saccharovorans]TPW34171.1 DNA polymerase III subunit gamma/tau [Oecophyllibacter saccharovorans]
MTEEELPLPPENGNGFFGLSQEPPTETPVLSAQSPASQVLTSQGAIGSGAENTAGEAVPYRVLARKYRPRHFDDLIGQDTLVRILRRAFETGRVAHAFMLTGVRGVGKTTTARIIARALNCTGPDGKGGPTADPCGVCPNCVAILADRHPDVLEMDAASRTGVDDVREIIEAARFRPMQGRMKVFVIDEVHMLSRNAFNALLKTLEEPPSQVTFIFATTELRKVPVTVLSRCQRFDLQRVPQALLAEHFAHVAEEEGAHFAPEALNLIARAADGSVRDGLSLLDQAIAQGASDPEAVGNMLGMADRGMVFDLLEAVMAGEGAKMLGLTEQAYALGADLGVVLTDLMEIVHLVTRLKSLPTLREGNTLPEMERKRGGALADRLSMSVLARAWQILLKGSQEVETAPDRRQAAEMVLIRLCHASLLPTPEKIVRQLQERQASAENSLQPENGSPTPAPSSVSAGSGASSSASSNAPQGPTVPSARAATDAGAAGKSGHEPAAPSALKLVANGGLAVVAEPAPAADPEAGTQPQLLQEPETSEAPEPVQIQPRSPRSWREMVGLTKTQQEPWLHGILRLEAHLVRFAPPEVALRLDDPAVRRRAFKLLNALLERLFPGQWRIVASEEPGEPTLDEQGAEVIALRRVEAETHPLVEAILQTFPGAKLGPVHDPALDDYNLPPEIPTQLVEETPELEFAPLDAEEIDPDDLD